MQVIFQWEMGAEVFKHIADVFSLTPCQETKRENCLHQEKVYEIDLAETFLFADFLSFFYNQP